MVIPQDFDLFTLVIYYCVDKFGPCARVFYSELNNDSK